jgi:hypothetical protein
MKLCHVCKGKMKSNYKRWIHKKGFIVKGFRSFKCTRCDDVIMFSKEIDKMEEYIKRRTEALNHDLK